LKKNKPKRKKLEKKDVQMHLAMNVAKRIFLKNKKMSVSLWRSPILYRRTARDAINRWEIEVVEDTSTRQVSMVTTAGQYGGKLVTTRRKVEGKNIGRKNETTAAQQAIAEAKKKMNDQRVEKHYTEDMNVDDDDDDNNDDDDNDDGDNKNKNIKDVDVSKGILPMLAKPYKPGVSKLKFPAWVQPKLDGVRALGYELNEKAVLQSRNNRPFPNMQNLSHILGSANAAITSGLLRDRNVVALDGEMYTDEVHFQKIAGLVRKASVIKPEDDNQAYQNLKKIHWYVYDCVMDAPFSRRYAALQEIVAEAAKHSEIAASHLRVVPAYEVNSYEEIDEWHNRFVFEGFEGVMIRSDAASSTYDLNKRSAALFKYKFMDTNEFKIVGYKEGKGTDEGTAIMSCETKEGRVFHVKCKGTREFRSELLNDGEQLIGLMLTVKHQKWSDDGIPRFPSGVTIRDYE
jgi:DNA ligase-1